MAKNGSIISFYSYKGGVGRSFILCNVAAVLSMWGYKILCIDWDLEAPGLHHYFNNWRHETNVKGLVELIEDFCDDKVISWTHYLENVNFPATQTPLRLLKAGVQDNSYSSRIQTLNWEYLYDSKGLGDFLEDMRDEWKKEFDFILIDSRTGVTDIGGICTVHLPDILAFVVAANHQNLQGSVTTVNRILKHRDLLPYDRAGLLTVPIISRLDIREEYELGMQWLKMMADQLSQFFKGWNSKDILPREVIEVTRVPYFSHWSYGERIPVIEEEITGPDSISYYLRTLAALFAHNVSETKLLVRNRDSFVNAASNRLISELRARKFEADFLISYSHSEISQRFVSELSGELKKRNLQIHIPQQILDNNEQSFLESFEDSLHIAKHIIVILEGAINPFQAEAIYTFSEQTIRDSTDRRIIPIVISSIVQDQAATILRKFSHIDAIDQNAARVAELITRQELLAKLDYTLEVNKNDTDALMSRATIYKNMKAYENALEDYNQVIKIFPRHEQALLNRGNVYLAIEKYQKALSDYQQVLENSPSNLMGLIGLGRVYRSIGRYEEALAIYSQTIKISPANDLAYIERAQIYRDMGLLDDALRDYTEAIAKAPKNHLAIVSRAQTYHRMQQDTEALADYTYALKLEPNSDSVLVERGRIYGNLNQFESALNDFDQAISINPNNIQAIYFRGLTNDYLGYQEKALHDFDRTLALDPDYERAILARGKIYLQKDMSNEAIADFNRVIRIDPKNSQAFQLRGIAHYRVGKYSEAEINFSEALKIDKTDPPSLVYLSLLLIQTNRLKEANEIVERGLTLYPNNVRLLSLFADVLANTKRFKEALDIGQRVLELSPKDAHSYHLYSRIFAKAGHYEEALEVIRRGLVLYPSNMQLLSLYVMIMDQTEHFEEASGFIARLLNLSPEDTDLLIARLRNAAETQEIE